MATPISFRLSGPLDRIALATLIALSVACADRDDGGMAFSRCNSYAFVADRDEAGVLADAKTLLDAPGIAMVEDANGPGGKGYLVVHVSPGKDIEMRQRVLLLGYQSIAALPKGVETRSSEFGHEAFAR